MMASRFRPVYRVGFCAVVALSCYLASQAVAAKRAELTRVERSIANVRGEIRQLQTEAGTLARLAQIERWNVEAFALTAPRAEQFKTDVQLANMNAPAPVPAPAAPAQPAAAPLPGPRVVQASYTPAPPAEAPATLRRATYVRPAGEVELVRQVAAPGPLDADLLADLGRLASTERNGGKR